MKGSLGLTPTPSADPSRVDRAWLAREAGPVPRAPWVLLDYDTRRWPFAAILSRDVYRIRRLDRLHVHLGEHKRRRGERRVHPTARDNVIVANMMAEQGPEADFWRLYHGFMLRVLAPLVGRGISYTQTPKLRIHLAGTRSVSSFHHDICVTKRIDQINFWMPFCDVADETALWLESDYGACDFRPVPVRYGQVLIFDGGYLGHGSVENHSDRTRVSLDMRFSYKRSATRAEGVALLNHLAGVLGSAPDPQICASEEDA